MKTAIRTFWIVVAIVAVAVAFSIGLQCNADSADRQAAASDALFERLRDGLVRARAALVTQKQLNAALGTKCSGLESRYRKEAQACIDLKAQLGARQGTGQGVVSDTAAVLDDQYLWVMYKFKQREFAYTIKPRPIGIILVRCRDGSYLVSGHDLQAGTRLEIDTVEVIEVPNTRRWWQDLAVGLGGGVFGSAPMVGASIAYKKNNAILGVGWRDDLQRWVYIDHKF